VRLGDATSASSRHSTSSWHDSCERPLFCLSAKQALFKALKSKDARETPPNKVASLIGKGLNFHPHMMVFYKLGPILDLLDRTFVLWILRTP